MNVRRGTPADLPRALEIWRSAVDATHGFLTARDRLEIDVLVAGFLPKADLWIATDPDDWPMGFLVMDGAKIEALFVDATAHGHGYGTLLLEHAAALEPNLAVDANEQATNALSFYLSKGFRVVGRSPTDGEGRPYPLVHLAR